MGVNSYTDINEKWKKMAKNLSGIKSGNQGSKFLLSRGSAGSVFDGVDECSFARNVPGDLLSGERRISITLVGSCLDTSTLEGESDSDIESKGEESSESKGDSDSRSESVSVSGNIRSGCGRNSEEKGTYERTSSASSTRNNLPLSIEQNMSILKNALSLIIELNEEDMECQENSKKESGSMRDELSKDKAFNTNITSNPYITVDAQNSKLFTENAQAPTSSLGHKKNHKTDPFRPTLLWDRFLCSSISNDTSTHTQSQVKAEYLTTRIIRKLIEKGDAGTVREILRILEDTFGHKSGNICLSLSPFCEQIVPHTQSSTIPLPLPLPLPQPPLLPLPLAPVTSYIDTCFSDTCLSVAARAGNSTAVQIILDSVTHSLQPTQTQSHPLMLDSPNYHNLTPRPLNHYRKQLAGTDMTRTTGHTEDERTQLPTQATEVNTNELLRNINFKAATRYTRAQRRFSALQRIDMIRETEKGKEGGRGRGKDGEKKSERQRENKSCEIILKDILNLMKYVLYLLSTLFSLSFFLLILTLIFVSLLFF